MADARETADAEEAITIAISALPQRSVRELLQLRERARQLAARQRLTLADVRELLQAST